MGTACGNYKLREAYHPFFRLGKREGARSTTAPCGRYRECELAQWSKLCEVSNEQTILGTTRGLIVTCPKNKFLSE